MTIPAIPWWIRLFGDGNAKTTAIGAVCFALGVMVGRGDMKRGDNYWRDLARSADRHWKNEYGWHDGHEHHGHYTQKENERENQKRHYER
jgi:hypothetical protein